jgi:hypothetical protein
VSTSHKRKTGTYKITRNSLPDSVIEHVYVKWEMPLKSAVGERLTVELMECIVNILRLQLSIDCKKVLRLVKVREYQPIMEKVVKA